MALGGDQEQLVELLRDSRGPERARVFSGYAGWGAGQLEREMAAHSWILCPARARFVFEVEVDELWAVVLRSLGPRYAHLATMPLDPRVN
jgi:putative transcriptional regulator